MSEWSANKDGHKHKHRFEQYDQLTAVISSWQWWVGDGVQNHLVSLDDDQIIPVFGWIWDQTNSMFWFIQLSTVSGEIYYYDLVKQPLQNTKAVWYDNNFEINIGTRKINVDPDNNHYVNVNSQQYWGFFIGNCQYGNGTSFDHYHKHQFVIDNEWKFRIDFHNYSGGAVGQDHEMPNSCKPLFFIFMVDDTANGNFEHFGCGYNPSNRVLAQQAAPYVDNPGNAATSMTVGTHPIYENSLDNMNHWLNKDNDDDLLADGTDIRTIVMDGRYAGCKQVDSPPGHIHPVVPDKGYGIMWIYYYTGDDNPTKEIETPFRALTYWIFSSEPKLYIHNVMGDIVEMADNVQGNQIRAWSTISKHKITLSNVQLNTAGEAYVLVAFSISGTL